MQSFAGREINIFFTLYFGERVAVFVVYQSIENAVFTELFLLDASEIFARLFAEILILPIAVLVVFAHV